MQPLTETQIRERAYQLWQDAGSPPDQEKRFWHEAEQQLDQTNDIEERLDNQSTPNTPLPTGIWNS